MNEFLMVVGVSLVAALLTWLGAPAAERLNVSQSVVSGALQFASGIIAALVALTLMPPAVQFGSVGWVALAFFIGGALFVSFDYYTARREAQKANTGAVAISLALYVGILVDLVIDGIVIGIGSTLTVATGLLVALGLAVSTMPLAFVTIATAKRQGLPLATRRRLSWLFVVCIVGGAMVGYLLLRNMSLDIRASLIALASGFLVTTVTQSMIPEANRDGEPSLAGIFFIAGMSLYGLLTFYFK